MLKEVDKHRLAYLTLILGLSVFVMAFLGVWPNRNLQRLAIAGVTVFYFVWGIISHVKTDTLNKRVALEYAAVALFGGFVLVMLTI